MPLNQEFQYTAQDALKANGFKKLQFVDTRRAWLYDGISERPDTAVQPAFSCELYELCVGLQMCSVVHSPQCFYIMGFTTALRPPQHYMLVDDGKEFWYRTLAKKEGFEELLRRMGFLNANT